MPTTSNFGWTTPADTDLVKDGAAAIRTLGNGIDTSLIDLKGGTTGQVLSKTSNTDLDYTWVTPNVGDITEVQAGTGISVASGTGPIPVVTNTIATTFDAKGDLVVGTGADTFAKLPVGTNGYTLVADSAETTGLKWAAPAGGGKILQVVSTTYSTATTSTSSSYVNSGLSLAITPSSASSKVLVLVTQSFQHERAVGYGGAAFKIVRGSTDIYTPANNYGTQYIELGGPTSYKIHNFLTYCYLDSPATTSSTTYKTMFAVNAGNTPSATCQYDSNPSSLILMEVGA